jgi:hypothetical protein
MSPIPTNRSLMPNATHLCPAPAVGPLRSLLTQIKKRYAADWNDMALSVENDSGCWTVRVQALAGVRTLYQAQRSTIEAAKVAGIEFAMFRLGGATLADSPEKLAHALAWKERW